MVKVRPQTAARADTGVGLTAGRNEFISFQVVVNGNETGATGVQATFPGLASTAGGQIVGDDVTMYREAFVNVTTPSFPSSSAGSWPDPLIPDVDEIAHEKRAAFPFDVPAHEARAVWVDVHVPADAPAGLYQGVVTLTASGGLTHGVNVALTVADFTLPSSSSLSTSFLLFDRNVCVAHSGDPNCNYDSGVHDALLGRYERMALEHRMSIPNLFSPPHAGGDWSSFDGFAAPFLNGTAPSRLAGAKLNTLMYQGAQSVPAYQDFQRHVSANGWLDRAFDYTADEPFGGAAFGAIASRASMVRQGAPGLRTLVTTSLQQASDNGVLPDVDILTPVVQWLNGNQNPYVGDSRPRYDAFLGANAKSKVWMYQSCLSQGCGPGSTMPENSATHGWPTYMLDVEAGRNRGMQWLDFLERVSGELYYETGLSLPTAWTQQYQFNGNGDGNLFYPGTPAAIGGHTDVPVAGIRMKLIRLGLQDFELLKKVSDSGDPAFARALATVLIPSSWQVPAEGASYDRARLQLFARLTQLLHGTPALAAQGSPPAAPAADVRAAVTTGPDPVTAFVPAPVAPAPVSLAGASKQGAAAKAGGVGSGVAALQGGLGCAAAPLDAVWFPLALVLAALAAARLRRPVPVRVEARRSRRPI